MYAMLLARFKMFPEVKEKGMSSVPRLVAFTSEHVGFTLTHTHTASDQIIRTGNYLNRDVKET